MLIAWAIWLGLVVALFSELAFFAGPGALLDGLLFRPVDGLADNIVFVWMLGVGMPVALYVANLWISPVQVGFSEDAVRVVWRLRTLEFPWHELRPGNRLPSKGWTTLERGVGGPREQPWFWATVEQARALLSNPRAPRHLFPPEYWARLGLPAPLAP